MIKLNGSRFTDIMPDNLKKQVEVQALAYAIGLQVEKLCARADDARTYATIQSMPERVLDLLAVELRTPAYDENYPIKTKRSLVENSLLYYAKMGTPSAMNNLIETVFGKGYITEWWEYGGDPHHFRVTGIDLRQVFKNYENFIKIMEAVKRKSSVMDALTAITKVEGSVFFGTAVRVAKVVNLEMDDVDMINFIMLTDENGVAMLDGGGTVILDA